MNNKYTRSSPNLSHTDQQRGDFKRLMPIVKEAMLHQVWLYNKQNGNWYTPEEFQAEFAGKEYNNYEIREMLENMVIRDPRGGNTAFQKAIRQKTEQYHQELNELTNKGEAFLNKVIEYYRENQKRR